MTTLGLASCDGGWMATVTPPQTLDGNIPVGKGAYCFVIDISGRCDMPVLAAPPACMAPRVASLASDPRGAGRSMNAAASVTTDDGDKVNHGWSQLDIAKHSTNTFISSLEDDDYFSVVTYSDGANVSARSGLWRQLAPQTRAPPAMALARFPHAAPTAPSPSFWPSFVPLSLRGLRWRWQVLVEWTKCDEAGRNACIAKVHSMRPERSTNLMAGITTGMCPCAAPCPPPLGHDPCAIGASSADACSSGAARVGG